MTAHPTEARRRTTIDKLARVFGVLRELDERRATPDAPTRAARLLATVQELWGSDELRAVSPTVLDEVRGGLVYFASTLADVVPRSTATSRRRSPRSTRAPTSPVPPLLSFGSWIGGDRDGNPYVTPETTRRGARAHARAVPAASWRRALEQLAGRLSLSERLTGRRAGAGADPGRRRRALPRAGRSASPALNPEEPYRRALTLHARAHPRHRRPRGAGGYAEPDELLADLRAGRGVAAARAAARSPPAATCATSSARSRCSAFTSRGWTSASTPRVHRARAGRDLRARCGVCEDYEGLPEDERLALLQAQIADRRPLIPTDIDRFSEATQRRSDLPHAARHARRTATAGRSRPTSSPAARARPTCSRCCC